MKRLLKKLKDAFKNTKPSRSSRRPDRQVRLQIENLEERVLLTTNLYLDFGFAFPNGRLVVSDHDMALPGINGPIVFGSGQTLISLTQTVQNQQLDLNGDGNHDLTDTWLLANQVKDVVQRTYRPFDVNVQLRSSANLSEVKTTLQSTSTKDTYVFIAGDSAPGQSAFGWSAGEIEQNKLDNVAFAFANQIIGNVDPSQRVIALASVAAHEAGHTFGLRHTVGEALIVTGDEMDGAGPTSGDYDTVNLFTRFNLPRVEEDGGGTQNAYDILAATLGLRAATPAYVTGTGGSDRITLTKIQNTEATLVTVEAFQDAAFTQPIDSTSYFINDTNGVLVEAGWGDDQVVVDATIGAGVTIHGGGGNDRLVVNGNGRMNGTYTPDSASDQALGGAVSFGGRVMAGAMVIDFDEFEPDGSVGASGFNSFTFFTPNSADDLTIDSPAKGQERIAGTSNKVGLVPLTVANVANLTVDAGAYDSSWVGDRIHILGSAAGIATRVVTGAGGDTINVGQYGAQLYLSGSLTIDGGAGINRLNFDDMSNRANAGTTYTVTTGNLKRVNTYRLSSAYGPYFTSTTASVDFSNVTNLAVSGGNSTNEFDVRSTAAATPVTIIAGGGGDKIVVGNVSKTLNSIAGQVAIQGGAGVDSVVINDRGVLGRITTIHSLTYTVTDQTVTRLDQVYSLLSPNLSSTSSASITYNTDVDSIELNGANYPSAYNVLRLSSPTPVTINAGSSTDTFNIGNGNLNALDGTLWINGGGETDAVTVNDRATANTRFSPNNIAYTITNKMVMRTNQVRRPGAGLVSYTTILHYAGVESLEIDGGSSGTVFNVQGLSSPTPVTIDAGSSTDTFNIGNGNLNALDGALWINGGAGADAVTMNDRDTANTRFSLNNIAYTITDQMVTRTNQVLQFGLGQATYTTTLHYAAVERLEIDGGKSGNAFTVQSTALATPVWIVAGAGNNTVTVGDTANNLDNVNTVHVLGAGGVTSLTVDDRAARGRYVAAGNSTYTITDLAVKHSVDTATYTPRGRIEQHSSVEVAYSGITSITLDASNGITNTVDVQNVVSGTPVTVYAGAAGNTIAVGKPADPTQPTAASRTLDSIQSKLTINGSGKDYLSILDPQGTGLPADLPANATVHSRSLSYAVTGQDVSRTASYSFSTTNGGGGGVSNMDIAYQGIDRLELDGSNVGVTFTVAGTSAATLIQGGIRNDTFKVTGAGNWTADGGSGVNTLDYSAFAGNVTVDLPLGTATGIAGGVRNMQNVIGGQGNNILVGKGGNVLTGGTGRNLLIAGATASTLVGNSAEDVLVGGTTDYDTNLQALDTLMAEWSRTDRPYGARVRDLLASGGLNGSVLLNVRTFHSNGGGNTLTGGAGLDLFYGLLPADTSTPDKTDWNPAQGEIFIDPNGEHVGIRIDATALTATGLTLDYYTSEQTASPFQVVLMPGSHLLSAPGGGLISFTVKTDGTIDFDQALDGILSGRGTRQLTINGARVTIDATALTTSSLTLDYYTNEQTASPFQVVLMPGSHLLTAPGGTGQVSFTVNPDGTVDYDQTLETSGILSGQGSRQLTVNGARVIIDATALTTSSLALDYYTNEQTAATFAAVLLPGSHLLTAPGGTGQISFTVNPDGSIDYDQALDGILSGRGSRQLTVNGVRATIDATALTTSSLALDYYTNEQTASPFQIVLMPGSHLLTAPGGTGQISFTVNPDGSISYDPSLQGVLSGQGSRQLTINGARVTIDATALTTSSLALDYYTNEQTASPFAAVLLPGSHLLTAPGGTGQVSFTVNPDGTVDYDQTLETSGILSGQGSRQLTINGVRATIDATALTTSSLALDYYTNEQTASPFQIVLMPGSHLLTAPGGGIISFTVNSDGNVSYDQALQTSGILSGQGTRQLTVNGARVTIDATALTATGLALDYYTSEQTAAPFQAVLLPGSHLLTTPGGSVISFTVKLDGTIDYDQALDGILSGRGKTTLVILQRA